MKAIACAVLCFALSPVFAVAQDAPALSEEEAAIVARVEANFDDSISFLEEVVNINSGTMNHEGVREVGLVRLPPSCHHGLQTEVLRSRERRG